MTPSINRVCPESCAREWQKGSHLELARHAVALCKGGGEAHVEVLDVFLHDVERAGADRGRSRVFPCDWLYLDDASCGRLRKRSARQRGEGCPAAEQALQRRVGERWACHGGCCEEPLSSVKRAAVGCQAPQALPSGADAHVELRRGWPNGLRRHIRRKGMLSPLNNSTQRLAARRRHREPWQLCETTILEECGRRRRQSELSSQATAFYPVAKP